jgi:16S rRNA (cytidine1402-2'-O)-methyltransferase
LPDEPEKRFFMSLIFVPTPLGNLRDITLRALDTLASCDLIAAEDTRTARKLLSAHSITGKTIVRHDQHSSPATLDALLETAENGCVAVITDAGTPGISDPGHALILRARQRGITIEALPGGTAFVCAALLSGFPLTPLLFDGFLPRTPLRRRARLQACLAHGFTTVWYETPHRLAATLELLARQAPDIRVFVARELTKKFEQQLTGTASEILAALPSPLKGEITLVVYPGNKAAPPADEASDDATLDERIDALLDQGESTASIAKRLAQNGTAKRQDVYARVGERRRMR